MLDKEKEVIPPVKHCMTCYASHNYESNFCSELCAELWIEKLMAEFVIDAVYRQDYERFGN